MDGGRFDDLVRGLASTRSRRGVLRAVGAAALGAIGLARRDGAEAAPLGKSAAAHFCKVVFTGDPPGIGRCVSAAAHGGGPFYLCGGDPSRFCNGVCVDTSSDMSNCGACGAVCTLDLCVNGRCGCNQGSEACNGACVASCPTGGCLTADCLCTCPNASCHCPAGTGCSGRASCGGYDSLGLCCSYPQVAFACHDSAGSQDGFVTCCTPGVDCPACPSGQYAQAGANSLCASPAANISAGGNAVCDDALCADPASCSGVGGSVSVPCS